MFAVTETFTVPPPDTDDRSTEIQSRSSLTLNVHADEPPAVADSLPAPLVKLSDAVEPAAEQPSACVICTRAPPILTVPVRSGPSFAVTDTDTEPPPDTLVESTEIQSWSSLTRKLHADEPPAVADSLPAPLVKLSDAVEPDAEHPESCEIATLEFPIRTVPDRAGPAFAVTDTDTDPSPGTDDLSVEIQSRSSHTGKLHSDDEPPALTDLLPELYPKLSEPGLEVVEQPSSCETATVDSPIFTVPFRARATFRATVTFTFPPPNTDDLSVEIQSWLSLTFHSQSELPVTVTSNDVPQRGAFPDVGSTEVGELGQKTPSWCTVNVLPAAVMLPSRSSVLSSLAATVYDTVSDAQLSIVIQLSVVLGVANGRQAPSVQNTRQILPDSGGVYVHDTVNEPGPPAALKSPLEEDSAKSLQDPSVNSCCAAASPADSTARSPKAPMTASRRQEPVVRIMHVSPGNNPCPGMLQRRTPRPRRTPPARPDIVQTAGYKEPKAEKGLANEKTANDFERPTTPNYRLPRTVDETAGARQGGGVGPHRRLPHRRHRSHSSLKACRCGRWTRKYSRPTGTWPSSSL